MKTEQYVQFINAFAPIFWRRLQHPEEAPDAKGGPLIARCDGDLKSAVYMEVDETYTWNHNYHIRQKLDRNKSGLVIPQPVRPSETRPCFPIEGKEGLYPVSPVHSMDLRGFKFCLSLSTHVGFHEGKPVDAFISMTVLVKNQQGRILYEAGDTEQDGYKPYEVADTILWFEVDRDETQPNELSVNYSDPSVASFKLKLNRLPEFGSTKVNPMYFDADCTERLGMFFWQLAQFMQPMSQRRHRKQLM